MANQRSTDCVASLWDSSSSIADRNCRSDIISVGDASHALGMSLRVTAKQSPRRAGDCFVATNAPRNDMIITTLP